MYVFPEVLNAMDVPKQTSGVQGKCTCWFANSTFYNFHLAYTFSFFMILKNIQNH